MGSSTPKGKFVSDMEAKGKFKPIPTQLELAIYR